MPSNIKMVRVHLKDEACDEGMRWLKKQTDVTTAWKNCKRGDWMQWLIRMLNYHDNDAAKLAERLFPFYGPGGACRTESDELSTADYAIEDRYYNGNKETIKALYSRRDRRRAKLADAIRKAVTPAELKNLVKAIKVL